MKIVRLGRLPPLRTRLTHEVLITGMLYWSMLEAGIGLFTACLPSLQPLFKAFPPSTISRVKTLLCLRSLRSGEKKQNSDERSHQIQKVLRENYMLSYRRSSSSERDSIYDVEAYPLRQMESVNTADSYFARKG